MQSKKNKGNVAGVALLVGVLTCAPQCCGFDPRSGYRPGLQVRSQVGVRTGGNLSVSLSLMSFSLKKKKKQ